jgi:hypothetical protein
MRRDRSAAAPPKRKAPLSNAERQRRWRQKHKAKLRAIQQAAAALLRNGTGRLDPASLRRNGSGLPDAAPLRSNDTTRPDPRSLRGNAAPSIDETTDDALTAGNRLLDHALRHAVALLAHGPGLTTAEAQVLIGRWSKALASVKDQARLSRRRLPGGILSPDPDPTRLARLRAERTEIAGPAADLPRSLGETNA